MLAVAAYVTVATPLDYGYVAQRWFTPPQVFFLAVLPLAGLAAFTQLIQALNRGDEHAPFAWSTAIFMVSFVGLAASLYPYLVPPAISLAGAASSSKTLIFMLAGIGMLLPVMLVYNGFQYLVFRGKILPERVPRNISGHVVRRAIPSRGMRARTAYIPVMRMASPAGCGGY